MSTTSTRGATRRGATSMSSRPPVRDHGELTGWARLVRLAARRDRIVLPVWLLALLGLMGATVASIMGLYATEAERTQYALVAAGNVVARVFDGPMSGTSTGAIVMTEAFGITALLAGIMSVQAVVRHTRLDEETGRAELIGSAVVGRQARLVAALTLVGAANLVLGVGTALILMGSGLPVTGSVLAGGALAGAGLTFAGVGAVAAQVAATARGANAIGVSAVGGAFLLRAIGDALGTVADSGVELVSAWPSWLSPIGWGQQVRPFGGDHAGVLVLFVGVGAGLVVVAFALTRHRDLGAGMVPVRPGPATARPWLTSPLGLAWRLQRGALLGWAVGLAALGAAIGSITDEVGDLLETSDELAAMLGESATGDELVEIYVAFTLVIVAYATAAYLVQALLRARTEETAGRAEPVLATAVSRHHFLGAHVLWAVSGAVVILLVVGLVSGVAAGLATGVWGQRFAQWLYAPLVHVPAVLVLGGIAVVAGGWVPRFCAPIAWGAVLGSLVVGQFGALLQLPRAVMDVSPFTHVPAVPAEAFRVAPLAVLSVVAGALFVLGFLGWRRRDLET